MLRRALASAPTLEDLATAARLSVQLPQYLKHPMTVDEARRRQRYRLEHREENFLAESRRTIYGQPEIPYVRLLRAVGCEYGDLERMVQQDGIETTLSTLFSQGVYLTGDEFKGRREVVRGSERFRVEMAALRHPSFTRMHMRSTSGSRDTGTPVPFGALQQQERSLLRLIALEARGGLDWERGEWGVPGSVVSYVLSHALRGLHMARWFSLTDPAAAGLHPRYRWSTRWVRTICSLAGHSVPTPEYVPLADPAPIVRWMAQSLDAGRIPNLHTYPSPAVRLSQAAQAIGIDLAGAQIDITGEPVTAARLASIERCGAKVVPSYSASDGPGPGVGCLAPEAADDVHLQHDLAGVVQPGAEGASETLPANALLITNLHFSSRFVMLNVSLGDQAVMVRRACGCPLDDLGLHTHLHTIRSFEKLTAVGMTFLDTDVIPVLEDILPAQFGGGPTDYQLVESEAEDGARDLHLLVHPVVGPIDERAVADAFLSAVGRGSGTWHAMARAWREAGLPIVQRRPPITTRGGKVLHVHVEAGDASTQVPAR